MKRFLRWCGILGVGALGGCGGPATEPSPPVGDVRISTDRAQYSLARDSFAVVTLTNESNRPLHLPLSGYIAYQRLLDGVWSDAFSWFTSDGIGRSFPLPALSSRQDQLEIWAYLAGQPGTYRFQYSIYRTPRLGVAVSLEKRVSAPFIVTP
ncbi:MAG: hypothetical protein M3Q37_03780 [Gemmatimonadota bacterium]|nr:hypothetical protein [Gemmatimonadota bacterium]